MDGKYFKDFKKWNVVKEEIQQRNAESIFLRQNAIWLVKFGVNVGSEMDGKGPNFGRPVIIVRVINSDRFLCVPVSSKLSNDKYHISFILNGLQNIAVISQIRVLDRKRCIRFIGFIDEIKFKEINCKIFDLFLKNETPQPPEANEGNLGARRLR